VPRSLQTSFALALNQCPVMQESNMPVVIGWLPSLDR
jgi:hypothetical protein